MFRLKRTTILLSLFVVIAAILVVAIAEGQLTLTVLGPINSQNITGTFLLNMTTINATNVTWGFWNQSGGFMVANFSNATPNEATNTSWRYQVNTRLLNDGNYNVTGYAFNQSAAGTNFNSTTFAATANLNITNVRVDNSAPLVTFLSPSSGVVFNQTNTSTLINATITDSVTNVVSVTYNLSNSSGQVRLSPAFQYGALVSQWSNNSLNISILGDGSYTLTVIANNSVNLSNATETTTFYVDLNPPTFTALSCTSVTLGTDPTCTCTATDSVDSNVTTSVSGHLGLTSAGGYTATCVATDDIGHSVTNTTGFTVSAASSSSGSSSGGGGGGAIVTNVATSTTVKSWSNLKQGETATLTSTDSRIAVASVVATLSKDASDLRLSVGSFGTTRPAGTRALSATAYQFMEISKTSSQPNIVSGAQVNFFVPTAWVQSNGVAAAGVALYHYVNNDWVRLTTTYKGTTHTAQGEMHSYSATTPSFSYFAVGAQPGQVAVQPVSTPQPTIKPTTTEPVQAPVVQPSDAQPQTEQPTPSQADVAPADDVDNGSGSSTWIWVVVIVVAIVLVGWFMMGGKKSKAPSRR